MERNQPGRPPRGERQSRTCARYRHVEHNIQPAHCANVSRLRAITTPPKPQQGNIQCGETLYPRTKVARVGLVSTSAKTPEMSTFLERNRPICLELVPPGGAQPTGDAPIKRAETSYPRSKSLCSCVYVLHVAACVFCAYLRAPARIFCLYLRVAVRSCVYLRVAASICVSGLRVSACSRV